MMRIITGTAKGIRLKTLEGDTTRPTAERVKEAVFSMLQMDIEGREVLDLFSGSGQMALEALSRGASSAVMLDSSPAAISVITENANKTKLISKCTIRRTDYLDYIKRNRGKKFDIVFLDPPYASGYYKIALRALIDSDMLKNTSLIVCESGEDTIFGGDEQLAKAFCVVKQSRYSKTFITVISPAEKEDV
ncbi:MAG: 16S rRNA (guanine(966)-N(2))-methyltransferase RsmD [Ruminococcaceae bacterium]|nr:16S rRNA (guanine(966)-N(2))-methyltransferase RsmD [Oscillospiraceae bacterium]